MNRVWEELRVKMNMMGMLLIMLIAVMRHHVASGADACIALLSDIEGNQERFEHFLAHHQAFERGKDRKWHLKPGAWFVFGGDVPDRFLGERQVLRELLRLKEEAPERVVLIAGNRDVNKLRLPLELSDAAMKHEPYRWGDDFQRWRKQKECGDSKAARLRWMLERTMGSPDAFELRRAEVARESGTGTAAVTDEEVVESYLADARPGGLFHRYLKASCLMFRLGRTLFVHAGMPQASLGHTPGDHERKTHIDDWLERLNQWYLDQLTEWESQYLNWDGMSPRPGEALMMYAEKWGQTGMNPFSVLYGRSVDDEGKVDLPPRVVVDWLKASGIQRLVVGHTPSGQIPVLQRLADGSFEMLVLDTSYGDPHRSPLVTLSGSDALVTEIIGEVQLSGRGAVPLEFQIRLGESGPLGTRLADGGILVAPHPGGWISYRLGPGYRVRYEHHVAQP